jgi:hypothetical protein
MVRTTREASGLTDNNNRTASWLRRFYEERIAAPLPYVIVVAIAGSVIMLVMTWAGWRGKFKPWGDPIPFTEAVSQLPAMFALTFVVCFVFFAIARLPRL